MQTVSIKHSILNQLEKAMKQNYHLPPSTRTPPVPHAYRQLLVQRRLCTYSPDTVLTVHASLPPLPLCFAVLYYAIIYSFQLQSGRAEPYGLVPTNLASQAWTSILAWYTDHPALAGATTAGGWETLHRLVGFSCPCPQLLPNQSVTLHHTYSIAHIGSVWGITD